MSAVWKLLLEQGGVGEGVGGMEGDWRWNGHESGQSLCLPLQHPCKEILKQCPHQGNWNQVNFVDSRLPVPVCMLGGGGTSIRLSLVEVYLLSYCTVMN